MPKLIQKQPVEKQEHQWIKVTLEVWLKKMLVMLKKGGNFWVIHLKLHGNVYGLQSFVTLIMHFSLTPTSVCVCGWCKCLVCHTWVGNEYESPCANTHLSLWQWHSKKWICALQSRKQALTNHYHPFHESFVAVAGFTISVNLKLECWQNR